jgi:hypothetical protein
MTFLGQYCWCCIVSIAMPFPSPQEEQIFFLAEQLTIFQEYVFGGFISLDN